MPRIYSCSLLVEDPPKGGHLYSNLYIIRVHENEENEKKKKSVLALRILEKGS